MDMLTRRDTQFCCVQQIFAKLAREQATLEEKIAELQNMEGDTEDEKPRHRWLSALGLKDEE